MYKHIGKWTKRLNATKWLNAIINKFCINSPCRYIIFKNDNVENSIPEINSYRKRELIRSITRQAKLCPPNSDSASLHYRARKNTRSEASFLFFLSPHFDLPLPLLPPFFLFPRSDSSKNRYCREYRQIISDGGLDNSFPGALVPRRRIAARNGTCTVRLPPHAARICRAK